jgi:hypothetical protein
MIDELGQYAGLCEEIGSEDADREIINEASFYIPAYRDYLIHRDSCDSFDDYIKVLKQKEGRGANALPRAAHD